MIIKRLNIKSKQKTRCLIVGYLEKEKLEYPGCRINLF